MNKKYIWLAAAILLCIAIFITTASPSATGGSTKMLFEKMLGLSENQASFLNLVFRKCVHLSAFGLLAILFFNGFEQKRFWLAWIVTTIYAATDEIHQVFLPNRTGAVIDVGIDSLGAMLALLLMKVYLKRKASKLEKKL